MEFAWAEIHACCDLSSDMLFAKFLGSSPDVVWSWPFGVLVLGLLGQNLVQANIRRCLCLALRNLFKATNDPQIVAASARLGCTCEGLSCATKLAFTSTGHEGISANIPRHPWIHHCQPLLAGCLLGSVTESASGRFRRMGLVDLLWRRGAVQASGKEVVVVPTPESSWPSHFPAASEKMSGRVLIPPTRLWPPGRQ